MFRLYTAVVLLMFTPLTTALAQPAARPGGAPERTDSAMSVERWVQQLAGDLNHLEEDLHYERGTYPQGLLERVDRASQSVAHFQHVLRQSNDRDHVRKDFREMDKQVHDLVKILQQSEDHWLRRQGSRIAYSDEQIHYTLQRRWGGSENRRELLARQAHLLENESRDLESLAERVVRQDQKLRGAIREFAEQAEHFHEVVEKGGDEHHLREDFARVDESWHRIVNRVNSSSYLYYLRAAAQDVNRVHNQIHELVNVGHHHAHAHEETPVSKAAPKSPPSPAPRRPAIEFEIPGIGRFQIPQ